MNVVTGAFGYTGKYIARRLLAEGESVKTITGHPNRETPLSDRVEAAPFNFDDPGALTETLRGAATLYNTYWIRFPHGGMTYDKAVANTRTLLGSAEKAGVQRVVHVSITNASVDSPFPYFRGKGLVEEAVVDSPMSYAMVRPTVIFGKEDVLINNIAWLLRRFPLFVVPGAGDYRLQPIFVEDVAQLAVRAGRQSDDMIVDAVGPEVFTFNELVRLIADAVGSRTKIMHLPPELALFLSRLIGYAVNDVMLTRDEMGGLRANLLVSEEPPTGETRLSRWLGRHAEMVGTDYASELERHYR